MDTLKRWTITVQNMNANHKTFSRSRIFAFLKVFPQQFDEWNIYAQLHENTNANLTMKRMSIFQQIAFNKREILFEIPSSILNFWIAMRLWPVAETFHYRNKVDVGSESFINCTKWLFCKILVFSYPLRSGITI